MDSTLLSLVDTHAHLCSPEFDPDLAEVLARACAAGVGAVIAVGETMADAERNLDLAEKFPLVKPAAGLYPTFLDRRINHQYPSRMPVLTRKAFLVTISLSSQN